MVIKDTQFHYKDKNNGKIYNEILASIGLDSPTTSKKTKSDDGQNRLGQDQDACTSN